MRLPFLNGAATRRPGGPRSRPSSWTGAAGQGGAAGDARDGGGRVERGGGRRSPARRRAQQRRPRATTALDAAAAADLRLRPLEPPADGAGDHLLPSCRRQGRQGRRGHHQRDRRLERALAVLPGVQGGRGGGQAQGDDQHHRHGGARRPAAGDSPGTDRPRRRGRVGRRRHGSRRRPRAFREGPVHQPGESDRRVVPGREVRGARDPGQRRAAGAEQRLFHGHQRGERLGRRGGGDDRPEHVFRRHGPEHHRPPAADAASTAACGGSPG